MKHNKTGSGIATKNKTSQKKHKAHQTAPRPPCHDSREPARPRLNTSTKKKQHPLGSVNQNRQGTKSSCKKGTIAHQRQTSGAQQQNQHYDSSNPFSTTEISRSNPKARISASTRDYALLHYKRQNLETPTNHCTSSTI